MINATDSVRDYILGSGGKTDEDKLKVVAQKVKKFRQYFDKHRIWLDEETCNIVSKVLSIDIESNFYKYCNGVSLNESGLGNGWVGEELNKLYENVNVQLPKAKASLESHFRKMLGADKSFSYTNI